MTDQIGTGSLRHPLGRRRFMVAVAGGGLLVAPLAVEAQQARKVLRVGLLVFTHGLSPDRTMRGAFLALASAQAELWGG